MHEDTQTRPATLTYIRLGGCRKNDRRFEEERDGEREKEEARRGWKEGTERGRRKTDGWEGWRWGVGGHQEQDGDGRSQRRDLFLIDLPRSPRPLTHVIIGRIFDLHSLWKGCVISSARSCVCYTHEVYFLSLTYK